jgi:hypothetical protein
VNNLCHTASSLSSIAEAFCHSCLIFLTEFFYPAKLAL